MSDFAPLVIFALVLSVAAASWWIGRKWDRERIQENIREHGGEVISIDRKYGWWWGGSYDRAYDVTYTTRHGKKMTATCRTSMWSGIYWVSDRPPGHGMNVSGEDETKVTEPIACLECGATIPSGKAQCPHCGWSYKGQSLR